VLFDIISQSFYVGCLEMVILNSLVAHPMYVYAIVYMGLQTDCDKRKNCDMRTTNETREGLPLETL
jgi:hypothetical protein